MLGNREKILLTLISGVVILLLSYTFFISPLKKELAGLDNKIRVKESNLSELMELKVKYDDIQESTKRMERELRRSAKNITLPSLLENLAKMTDLKENMTGLKSNETIKSKNYTENSVEITLRGIAVDELMEFVYKLETLPYIIKIKGFKIKTTYGKAPKLINLTLLVSLFTPN